ncbi:uncharacterized protein LOC107262119 [Ricinus communis]|uniref:uncharacterized protein LOC107262119 n=1 Tax=Ricinus communis TaxID=3988 RepID=UPI00201A9908|nr:uncharacterized protein LOC107262119 [Ricinus communis]
MARLEHGLELSGNQHGCIVTVLPITLKSNGWNREELRWGVLLTRNFHDNNLLDSIIWSWGNLCLLSNPTSRPLTTTHQNFIRFSLALLNLYIHVYQPKSNPNPKLIRSSTCKILRRSKLQVAKDIPRGYLAVYVGENQKKRFIVPISMLDEPSFQELLRRAEEEFGFNHPMGGLTIPCREDTFLDITSRLN